MNTLSIILIILSLILIYVVITLSINYIKRENEIEELLQHVKDIHEIIKFADIKLEEVDSKGSFKTDDEVGFIFTEIQNIQNIINLIYNSKINATE